MGKTSQQVKCPKCGCLVDAEVTNLITDDNMKALLDGRLNRTRCKLCGEQFAVETSLVFKDAETGFILYLIQPPEDGETEQIENEIDAMATDVFSQENLERPCVRLTFFQVDFIEKIAIHKLGFDDRLIEYAKLQLFRNIDELQLSRTKHRLLLDYTHCDEKHLYFLVYDRELLKPINAVEVPMDEFNAIVEEVKNNENLLLELEAAFPGCYVSADRLL